MPSEPLAKLAEAEEKNLMENGVEGIDWLLTGAREFTGAGANRLGERNGKGRETKAPPPCLSRCG